MAFGSCSVGVIIPALNEETALPLVLTEIPPEVDRVVVVDNGSTDRTAQVAQTQGAHVVREEQRGYGAACYAGLLALGPHDIVVFLDGDYSDCPSDMPLLVWPIVRGEADLVIGSRLLGTREDGAMPGHSLFGNRLISAILRRHFRIPCTDLGPFRAIRRNVLDQLQMQDRGYGWTLEMQIKAARMGLRIREVPVRYRKRLGQSKISGTLWGSIRAGTTMLRLLAKHIVLPVLCP